MDCCASTPTSVALTSSSWPATPSPCMSSTSLAAASASPRVIPASARGAIVPLRSEIDISALPPGDYELRVALYDWQTGARLPPATWKRTKSATCIYCIASGSVESLDQLALSLTTIPLRHFRCYADLLTGNWSDLAEGIFVTRHVARVTWLWALLPLLLAAALAIPLLDVDAFNGDEPASLKAAGVLLSGPSSLGEIRKSIIKVDPHQTYGWPILLAIWGRSRRLE